MSAASAIITCDAAWILADAAAFDDVGRIVRMGSKVAFSADHQLALTCTGLVPPRCADIAQAWLDRQPDQATVLAGLPDLLSELGRHLRACRRPSLIRRIWYRLRGTMLAEPGIRITAAWWDGETSQPMAAIVSNVEEMDGELAACTVHHLPGSLLSPTIEYPWWSELDFDPLEDGARIAQIQRHDTSDMGCPRVGGWFEAWKISADGIERLDVVSWPDAIGEKISLSASAGIA